MTTSDYDSDSRSGTRPIEERDASGQEPGFDELIAHEEAYTPPPTRDDTSQDAVPIEVVPVEDSTPEDSTPDDWKTDDPTPPDVAPQAAAVDGPVDNRPDVPRDLDGDPTDFEPLRVQTVGSEDPVPDPTPDPTQNAPAPAPAHADAADDGAPDDASRWQQIQVRFVDDPAAAVGEASELVEGAVARLREAHGSSGGSDGSGDSTERLRVAFRRYRALHELATRSDVP